MTSQPENEPAPSASESIQPTDPNTVAEPVHSSSTLTSPPAATAEATPAPTAIPSSHAHSAFPSLPQPGKLPSIPQEIHQILSLPADQFTAKGLPLLAKVADGKPFEGASLKAWERRNAGEQLLALYEAGDQVYETADERVKEIGGGLVYVLSARLNLGQGNPVIWSDKMLDFAINLCELADPVQLRICHQRVAAFAWCLLRLSQQLSKVELVISAITSLIQKLNYRQTFSPIFGALLEACLITRQYDHPSLGSVLNIIFLDVKTTAPTYLDILTYYHHAGTVNMAMGDFRKAKEYYLTAVTAPTTTASAIQLACAKRALLCELIVTGKKILWPKYTPTPVTRIIEKYAVQYNELAKQFEAHNWAAVQKAHTLPEYEKDCNKGLIGQVIDSIHRHMILRLRKTYRRLTVDSLARRLRIGDNLPKAERVVAILDDMIQSGEVSATLTPSVTQPQSHSQAIVEFITTTESFTSPEVLARLEKADALATLLQVHLAEGNRRLGASKEYLRKQAQSLEFNGRKDKGDDFDQLMEAEEAMESGPGSGKMTGSGGGGGSKSGSLRGVSSNMADIGF
ncbi:COP9 signalosome complex subunit 3 [Cryptococcus deuterogattii R265]|uniref:COP9 signalosome complex subunit 3 n=1 Tax=Cryptococcus deuterogattii (strain R265) TaxID=294750 RepID=UPI001937E5A7|nr:COP9 signalosome complex subunit 3 [Cryptococcus deuterogattii R265]